MSYLDITHDVYKEAALSPDIGLCCTTNPIWELPGLKIPKIMQEMNYGIFRPGSSHIGLVVQQSPISGLRAASL
jgi:hypothetical protein